MGDMSDMIRDKGEETDIEEISKGEIMIEEMEGGITDQEITTDMKEGDMGEIEEREEDMEDMRGIIGTDLMKGEEEEGDLSLMTARIQV